MSDASEYARRFEAYQRSYKQLVANYLRCSSAPYPRVIVPDANVIDAEFRVEPEQKRLEP